MHAVINRLKLATPIDPAVFARAQEELPPRVAEVDGLRAFHVLRAAEDELVVLILADTAEALDELRDRVGNAWMRENIVPHLAGGTDRMIAEGLVGWDRPAG
jgi:hypothetical protein